MIYLYKFSSTENEVIKNHKTIIQESTSVNKNTVMFPPSSPQSVWLSSSKNSSHLSTMEASNLPPPLLPFLPLLACHIPLSLCAPSPPPHSSLYPLPPFLFIAMNVLYDVVLRLETFANVLWIGGYCSLQQFCGFLWILFTFYGGCKGNKSTIKVKKWQPSLCHFRVFRSQQFGCWDSPLKD